MRKEKALCRLHKHEQLKDLGINVLSGDYEVGTAPSKVDWPSPYRSHQVTMSMPENDALVTSCKYARSSVFSKTGGSMPLHNSGLWPIYIYIIIWKTITSKIIYLHYILVLLHPLNLKSGKWRFIHWDSRTKKRHVSHPGGDIKRDWTHLGGAIRFCPHTLGRYPKLPKPPKDKNFFINCWWNIRGTFQGYVGEILKVSM